MSSSDKYMFNHGLAPYDLDTRIQDAYNYHFRQLYPIHCIWVAFVNIRWPFEFIYDDVLFMAYFYEILVLISLHKIITIPQGERLIKMHKSIDGENRVLANEIVKKYLYELINLNEKPDEILFENNPDCA